MTSSPLPLYKDRSDLRLSARYVYQQATTNSSSCSSSSLSSLISVKCCLQALFGVDEEKGKSSSPSNSIHQIFMKRRSSLEQLILEEAHKLYDGNDSSSENNVGDGKTIDINQFLPLEEALFVKIAERIYLHQQQVKEEGHTHQYDQTLNEAFWNELVQFTSASSCCRILKETFLKER